MAADMICAYYDHMADSRPLFEGLNLTNHPDWDRFLGNFNVIRIVMTDFIKRQFSIGQGLLKMQKLLLRDLRRSYPDVDYFDPDDLLQSMTDIYETYHHRFVIVIDEWDAVFRVKKEDREGQTEYLDFLRDWMKDQPYIALAYMTGILPIKKYGQHSALNMFDEYSMTDPMQLAPFTGFTEEEVEDLCNQYGRELNGIKKWYNGYQVRGVIPADPGHKTQKETGKALESPKYTLYNPLSVVKSVSSGLIKNYWNKTENYQALAEYIQLNFDGLKNTIALLMDGGRAAVRLEAYQNDMTTFHSKDDVLALLIHLGYLGYDSETGEVFVPNREILDEFKTSTDTGEWQETFEMYRLSQLLLEATWAGDAEKVAEIIERAHHKAGNQTYHNEAALSYAIQLAYYSAQKYYTVIPELDTGKGYADLVYLPTPKHLEKPALLIELKYDQTADTAIRQIHRQQYPDRLEQYRGHLILVGISYNRELPADNPDFKHHTCIIERA